MIPQAARDYFGFVFAKDFRLQSGEVYHRERNGIEGLGERMRWGVENVADFFFRNIRNPVMIVALTALAMLAVTIVYYSEQITAFVAIVLPAAAKVKPWMLKVALYFLVQSTIASIGIRTFGRFSNAQLVEDWWGGRLEAVYIGDQRR